ncbi:ABC transporter substrate-binding protein [Paraburkholderia ginsengiterrae]|uniref:ABC transporter substrate-binding protein n=1 Tax=Paraburkholderia ginsengiterrae TaxID=1462993 RepID=A0A1A9N9I2_9BURK|nr:transporter substrate-binding domain-containing protein [Paraburkholderia ginsengiterrae]OAJ57126.1 ABC transporter substrate-binding protein [Paraburkholderia ginsengiterrae]OAJ61351.1 ABC transporter substrate-binding protein [Paraburkholderia ginsengiterrae]
MKLNDTIVSALAPNGTLRATINLGNPILANTDQATGRPFGVSVDLATELAERLGVPVEFLVVDAAAKAVDAVTNGRADVGFFAVDPVRGAGIAFSSPYVLIEGCYLVRQDSPITDISQVDESHNRVAVGGGSAYDLFLSRELIRADIIRVPTSPVVVDTFVEQGLEVAAGVKQQLLSDAMRHSGLRLLEEPFMVIQQAMGVAKARGDAATQLLEAFVEELKTSGHIAGLLARHDIRGATVAPPAK